MLECLVRNPGRGRRAYLRLGLSLVHNEAGARVCVMVRRRAYSAPSFGVNLLSAGPAQTDGCWATEFSVERPALVTVDGTRVPLTKVDNTWSFWCEIEPRATSARLDAGLGAGRFVAPPFFFVFRRFVFFAFFPFACSSPPPFLFVSPLNSHPRHDRPLPFSRRWRRPRRLPASRGGARLRGSRYLAPSFCRAPLPSVSSVASCLLLFFSPLSVTEKLVA